MVWLCSSVYSLPRFFMFGTVNVPDVNGADGNNSTMTICVMKQRLYDVKAYDTAQFVLCFLLPLTVISILYFRISSILWRNNFLELQRNTCSESPNVYVPSNSEKNATQSIPLRTLNPSKIGNHHHADNGNNVTETKLMNGSTAPRQSRGAENNIIPFFINYSSSTDLLRIKSCSNVETCRTHFHYGLANRKRIVESRRKVIRLLVTVVLTFALCNAPHHIRKLWLHWSTDIDPSSNFLILLTPITWLGVYLNSALNPIIYAFLSENFRRCMIETVFCNRRFRIQKRLPRGNYL